tara:strand:- start:411 stop:635 length:225 start_codon:yes stop_codon:yes gene_type:complete
MFINLKHLQETKNTYFTHFQFAFPEALWAFCISIIMFIHAFFPFIFWNGNFDRYIRDASKRLDVDQERWKNGAE